MAWGYFNENEIDCCWETTCMMNGVSNHAWALEKMLLTVWQHTTWVFKKPFPISSKIKMSRDCGNWKPPWRLMYWSFLSDNSLDHMFGGGAFSIAKVLHVNFKKGPARKISISANLAMILQKKIWHFNSSQCHQRHWYCVHLYYPH